MKKDEYRESILLEIEFYEIILRYPGRFRPEIYDKARAGLKEVKARLELYDYVRRQEAVAIT